jgi:hypothetical protein
MEASGKQLLTAAEFACAVNLSDRQIRRLMRSGRLNFEIGDDRIARIPESEVERFQKDRHVRVDAGVRTDKEKGPSGRPSVPDMDMNFLAHQLFPLHERALKLLEEERRERQAAQESAHRAESQLLGLQYTVQSYQRALTENAESIAEQESLRQVAISQAREATQEREKIRAEQETVLENLKLAHERISWLEKRLHRLPRWVRRWLEVG